MLILIGGTSGSGKSTLCQRLKERLKDKIIIRDTDDISTEVVNKYISKYDFLDDKQVNKYFKDVDRKIRKEYRKLEKLAKTKIVIITGWYSLYKNVTHGFVIKQKAETIYKRLNKRLIDSIVKIQKSVYDHDSPSKIAEIMYAKYKVFGRFPTPLYEIQTWVNAAQTLAHEQGYKYTSSDTIYNDVCKLVLSK